MSQSGENEPQTQQNEPCARVCRHCKQERAADAFEFATKRTCRDCRRAIERERWRAKHGGEARKVRPAEVKRWADMSPETRQIITQFYSGDDCYEAHPYKTLCVRLGVEPTAANRSRIWSAVRYHVLPTLNRGETPAA